MVATATIDTSHDCIIERSKIISLIFEKDHLSFWPPGASAFGRSARRNPRALLQDESSAENLHQKVLRDEFPIWESTSHLGIDWLLILASSDMAQVRVQMDLPE